VAPRLRVFAQQQRATRRTTYRPQGHDAIDAFNRQQAAPMSQVTWLSTGLPPRRRLFGARRSLRRIGRGRFGRVARVLIDPFFQFSHACLERRYGFEQRQHQRFHRRWGRRPIFGRYAWRKRVCTHATSITGFSANGLSPNRVMDTVSGIPTERLRQKFGEIPLMWCHYRWLAAARQRPATRAGFVRYLRLNWGLVEGRRIPGFLVAKTIRRLKAVSRQSL
jgi:hypothetical protein